MDILLATHGKNIHSLLAATNAYDPTPGFFIEEMIIHYSPDGSNNRTMEEAIILHWADFIASCQQGMC